MTEDPPPQAEWIPGDRDYIAVSAAILACDPQVIAKLPRFPLASSALAAPFAEFGGQKAYGTTAERATVLVVHLAKNHPLPDGNKRAAFAMLLVYLERNGFIWGPADLERDALMVEAVAAGEASASDVLAWILERTSV